jgi:hypothetical protein
MRKHMFAVLLLIGLLTSCVLVPQSIPSAIPSAQFRTVSPSTLAEANNWKTYESSAFGLSLNYPSDFSLEEQSAQTSIALWLSFTSPDDPGNPANYEPPFSLIVYENPTQQPLIDWFSAHMSDPPEYGQKPAEAVAFLSPIVDNQDDFQGHAALQYESGAFPVRYEKLIEQDGWVIGLYYHRDNPFDYGTAYEQVLTSLELTPPLSTPVLTPKVITPTPVPIVCLDAQAKPQDVPPREQPLEVGFISDGNIWTWQEGKPAWQISGTGDALHFTFSPDGEIAVFERLIGSYPYDYKIELWAINKDGSNLRKLVSTGQFDQFLTERPERQEAWIANLPTDYRWFAGTHRLSFGVYQFINLVGGSNAAQGYWIVNTDTLALERWEHPEAIDPYGPKERRSPDGKVIALVDRGSISLENADGSVIRKDVLTYPFNSNGEGPGWGAPQVVWSPDSQFLHVAVWEEDTFLDGFSTWQIPADGSPAKKLHTFDGLEYFSSISPNQEYIAYLHRPNPMANENELHLARFDGSADVIYATGYQLYFEGWSPDSYHFVYDLFATNQPILGSLCGKPVSLVESSDTPATQITWVDATHFLFVEGREGQLKLGQVGEKSLQIGPFVGENAYYEIRQGGQDVIAP